MCMYVCCMYEQRIRQLEGSSRGLIGNIRQQAEKHVAELTNLREQIQVRWIPFFRIANHCLLPSQVQVQYAGMYV